ncbi:MAG: YihY/virulence factor BrkB family protein [Opitutaceae bacterium]
MALPGLSPIPKKVGLAARWRRLVQIYQREIWQSTHLKDRSPVGCAYAVLRVISITVTVFFESRIVSRAAALSFSSLLGLGPLIAIAVLVAGFALGKNDPNLVADTLNRLVKIVAPQIAQYETLTQTANQVNPQLVDVINNIIKSSQSSSAPALGMFTLLVIVLLLFKSIEDTFNDIWGVRQGRSVVKRIVLYWTVLTLGAVLFFSAVALLGASTFFHMFDDKLPDEVGKFRSVGWLLQLASFSLLAALLTVFYRVIPNTRVFWRAALIGGLVVGGLLVMNNVMAFLFVKRVLLERNLYGSLALPFVVISGLFIFWLCVLTGGIVSYAVQNVHFRNSQAAWGTLSEAMRERLALVVFLTICRRFNACMPPASVSMLGALLKVPAQLLNECLSRLVMLKLVTALRPPATSEETEDLYQPAQPLNRLTLFDFKNRDDNFGDDPADATIESIDPIVGQYNAALARLGDQEFFQQTVDQLLTQNPFEESRPPFAMGARRAAK